MKMALFGFCFLIGSMTAGRAADDVETKMLAEGAVSPPARIEQLSWLAGHWKGVGFGGEVVENISPAAGGQMMGAFYHLKEDGTLNFYEFFTFAEVDDTIVLRIKHFTPDLVGWEEKEDFVEFPLVAIEDRAVHFNRLSFVMTSPDTLEAAVDFRNGGIERFYYERQSAP